VCVCVQRGFSGVQKCSMSENRHITEGRMPIVWCSKENAMFLHHSMKVNIRAYEISALVQLYEVWKWSSW